MPCVAWGDAEAAPPCHRIDSDGLTCSQSESADSCAASYAHFEDGSCGSADYAYCFTGAFGMELWAKGDGESCSKGLAVLQKTGYKNDGCGGKSKPLPCGDVGGVDASPPCHRIDSEGLTCTQSESSDSCAASYAHFEDGSCGSADYAYCFTGAFGMELWAKGDGESCSKGLAVLKKAGYKNDGCGGKSKPLPCGDVAHAQAAPPCHRIDSDGLTCTQSEDTDSCAASYARFEDGSCSSADYAYCFKGAFGTELWAKGDGESCSEGLAVLKKTGYKNDGCEGKSQPLPCGDVAGVDASPPCHRIDSEGLTCTQSESSDSCAASYAHFGDGSCGSADYAYCFTGAFGMELWAKGDGESCSKGLAVLKKTGYKNDGCEGKSEPLPCTEAALVVV